MDLVFKGSIRRLFKTFQKQQLQNEQYASHPLVNRKWLSIEVDKNKEEAEKHGTFSSLWWDQNGEMAVLQALNKLRVPFIRDGLKNSIALESSIPVVKLPKSRSSMLSGFKILDVGCGGGVLCEPLARIGADVVGLEPSEALIEVASSRIKSDPSLRNVSLRYVNSSIGEFAQNSDQQCYFDAVVLSEVIEHVPDKEKFLTDSLKMLKKGGSVFITTPNRTPISWLLTIVVAENTGITPKGIHNYDKYIRDDHLQQLLQQLGCRIRSVHGWIYNPISKSCLWIDSTAVMYMVHAQKLSESLN